MGAADGVVNDRVGGHSEEVIKGGGEGLSGQADEIVYQRCIQAGRALLTLDLDFANPFRFPPEQTEGIVVLRPPRPVLPMIRATLAGLLPELKTRMLKGKTWIVEPGRVRVYDPDAERELA